MLLVIDIGNTTVALGVMADEHTILTQTKLETNHSWNGTDYADQISAALQKHLGDIEAVVVSSVVPAVRNAVFEAVEMLWHLSPMEITRFSKLGIVMDVDEPEQMGRDRLVDSAWAAAHYPAPLVTVDTGTATTFNVINPAGQLCGGMIAPGVATSLRALASLTAQLPLLEPAQPRQLIGRTTKDNMLSGAIIGTAAMIDGLVGRIEAQFGQPVTLVLTGGAAKFIKEYLQHAYIYEPEMMLKGLAWLYWKTTG